MLKKLSTLVGVLGVLALLAVPPALAQPQSAPGKPGKKAARMYNPQAVETLVGKVASVNRITPKKAGRPERVNMMLQTDKETLKVQLGPANYIDQQPLKLAAGDQVEVKGVRVTRPQVTLFMAGELKKGDQVLKLRDDTTGKPLWAPRQPRSGAK